MRLSRSPLLIIVLHLFLQTGHALSLQPNAKTIPQNFINHKDWSFVENKGQLTDEKGNLITDVKYYSHDGGSHIYCRPGMISFVFSKIETANDESISEATGTMSPADGGRGWNKNEINHEPSKITTCRADLVLVNSNPKATILASDQQDYYENYYTTHEGSGQAGDANQGITEVHTFKKITYKNIYPHIDLILKPLAPSSAKAIKGEAGLEYSFLVHPGGDVKNIKLHWNGMNTAEMMADGGIKYATLLASIQESAPRSFVGGESLQSRFVKNGSFYGFKVSHYDKTKDLLIDPDLAWSTFFGGSNDDKILAVSSDPSGNSIITGSTQSAGLSEPGAYQTSIAGNTDVFVARFSASGLKSWCTYYGGQGDEFGTAACFYSGIINIAGTTTSSSGIVTSGAYQTTSPKNTTPAFFAQFSSSSGLLFAATYFGYSIGVNAMTADESGIYMAGNVGSISHFSTNSSYQPIFGGGSIDAFLIKFKNPNTLGWCSFFGGSDNDGGMGVSVDPIGNVYLSGYTYSTSNITFSSAYQTSIAGNSDAFLAKFTSTGSLSWATYFGGTGYEFGRDVCTDKNGNVYLTGSTSSKGLATSGAFQTSFTGNYNAFLTKFSKTGSPIWSTYYGNSSEGGLNVKIDGENGLFLLGSTNGSSSGLATSGAFQTKNGGSNTNLFLAKFDTSGIRKWATYFGGADPVFISGLAVDHSENVYITGYDAGSSGIASSGAFQTSNEGKYDGFLVKFDHFFDNDAGINAIYSPNSDLCAGTTIPIKVNLKNFGASTLTAVDMAWSLNGLTPKIYKWSGSLAPDSTITVVLDSAQTFSTGSYNLTTYTVHPNGANDSLNGNDTSRFGFTSFDSPKTYAGGSKSMCRDSYDTLGSSSFSNHNYAWTSNPVGFISSSARPVVSPTENTWYKVVETIKGAGCTNTDSALITVNPLPAFSYPGFNQTICKGTAVTLGTSGKTGYLYQWTSVPAGFSSSSATFTVSPHISTVYKRTYSIPATGCNRKDSVTVTVNPVPSAITGHDTTICAGAAIKLGASAISGHYYSWSSVPAGFVSYASRLNVKPDTTTKYLLEEGINVTGCTAIDSVLITVNPKPAPHAGGNHAICKGGSISIGEKSAPGYLYTWTSAPSGFGSTSSSNSVSPLFTTRYYLKETISATGCSAVDSAAIIINPLPDAGWFMSQHKNTTSFHANDSATAARFLWTFGDGVFDSISGPITSHTYSKTSAYLIKLKVENSFGCISEHDSALNITLTGIESTIPGQLSINIYPNPFQSTTTIQYDLLKPSQIKIALFDITGKQVGEIINQNQVPGQYQTEINADKLHLNPGMYLLKFRLEDELVTKQLIKF